MEDMDRVIIASNFSFLLSFILRIFTSFWLHLLGPHCWCSGEISSKAWSSLFLSSICKDVKITFFQSHFVAMKPLNQSMLGRRHVLNDTCKYSVDCSGSFLHRYTPSSRNVCPLKLSWISWTVYASCTSDYNYVIKLSAMQIDGRWLTVDLLCKLS